MALYTEDTFRDNSLDLTKWGQVLSETLVPIDLMVEQNKRLECNAPAVPGAIGLRTGYPLGGKIVEVECYVDPHPGDTVFVLEVSRGERHEGVHSDDLWLDIDFNWYYCTDYSEGKNDFDAPVPAFEFGKKYVLAIGYSDDGKTAYFYINGTLVKTVSTGIVGGNIYPNIWSFDGGRFNNFRIYDRTIYLDNFNGNDSWPGTEEYPIKTVQRLLYILVPGSTTYFVGVPEGQPDFIYEIADYVFWDIEGGTSAEALFRAIQYIALAQSRMSTLEVESNYYIKRAENLQRFSSLYPLYDRNLSFEDFRKRLLDIWFGYQEPSTILGLNRIAGAYTGIPLFAHRYLDDPFVWIIGRSYLNQIPLENYIPGMSQLNYGAIFETFGWSGISDEVRAEFDKIFEENASLSPFGVVKYEEAEPPGFLLLKNGYHNFDLMNLDNMEITTNPGEVVVINPDLPASLETYPVLIYDLVYYGYLTGIQLNLFERLYSDDLTRKIYYAWGDTESSFGPWQELKYVWPMTIPLDGNYLKFKIEVSDISAVENYALVSIMLKGL